MKDDGELDRFAVDHALRSAWVTEFWIPGDPDYSYLDYFEAAVTRNLTLLRGFEDLAEDVDRRGILPQADGPQTTLVTDGGTDQSGDAVGNGSHVTVIDQHPLPLTTEDAEQEFAHNPMFADHDDVLHPDTFHDRYKDVLGENEEWRIFRAEMYPYSNTVFVWNHQLGFGLRVHDGEGEFRSLVEAIMRAAEEVA